MKKKVAFVSGSTKGIGLAIATSLAKNQYVTYLNGRSEPDLNEQVARLKAEGLNVEGIAADLTSDETAQSCVRQIVESQGQLDLVVANIGNGRSPQDKQLDTSEYQRVFDINFFSTVALFNASIPEIEKSQGQLIAISSIAGCEALGAPITYSAAKAALNSYVKNLSLKLGPAKVCVNLVSPGNVMFPGSTWDTKTQEDPDSVGKYIENNVPLNKFISPNEIADSVLFLARSQSITGHNLVVDAGQIKGFL